VLGLPTGVVHALKFSPDSKRLAIGLESAAAPADVWSFEPQTGQLDRWTRSETGGLDPAGFVEPSLIRFTSFDKRSIPGFLYEPKAVHTATGRLPVIISIHGGPDVGALLDWIAARPELDPTYVVVSGASYGGFMTLSVFARYGDQLAGAYDVVGMSNLVSFLERTEAYRQDLRRVEYGDERDPAMRKFMEETAPLNNTAKMTKPLFVVAGRNDPRVPYTEAEQLVAKVRAQGGDVWYMLAKDEGHGFRKKPNRDAQRVVETQWLRKVLRLDDAQ